MGFDHFYVIMGGESDQYTPYLFQNTIQVFPWIDKYHGKFDQGWNALREQIFANQKRLGVIPGNARLTEWPDFLPEWDIL